MKKTLIVLLHVGFWGCSLMIAISMIALSMQGEPETDARIIKGIQTAFFFGIFPSFLTFYGFYFNIFPKLQSKQYWRAAGLGFVIAYISAFIGYLALEQIHAEDCIEDEGFSTLIGLTMFMTFITTVAGVLALVLRGFITWFEEVKLREALKSKNQAMELALLKAQLDPHFLFNTINNIDVLILRDPNIASEYLNKLSDIMRFTLFETKHELVPLKKEIEYIDKYIELQKIRTANEQYVKYTITGSPNGHSIAPMVFIPFIENAFKHTTNKKLEHAISIQLNIKPQSIQMICENKYDTNRSKNVESNGLGNALITKRLDLLYPNQHTLSIKNEEEVYHVNLEIHLENT